MSDARWQPGTRLYRPWQGPGISINALGMRTPPPAPKASGDWRTAVTGGSAVWGWRVLDADTIPAQLQQAEHASGRKATFYNFGVEGATLMQELALLKQFRDIYGIDQVILYTGANDALSEYLDVANQTKGTYNLDERLTSFELVKAAARLIQTVSAPSVSTLDKREHEMLAHVHQVNRLRAGLIAADEYCSAVHLRCDFVLQPLLFTRARPVGPEIRLIRTFKQLYPGFAAVAIEMYRDALASVPAKPIHDLSGAFDEFAQPVFTDNVHINEVGNRLVAEHIRATVSIEP